MLRIAVVLGLIFAANFAGAAFGQVTTSVTATSLETILIGAGYAPKMGKSDQFDGPYASIKGGGFNFSAEAANCHEGTCSVLLLFANFDLDRDITLKDYQTINSYNDSELLGRAYVNLKERQVGIDLVFDLEGGVEQEYIRLKTEKFPELIQTFVDLFLKSIDEG